MTIQASIVISVSAEGKLELPPAILAQLQPFAKYEVSVTENEIVLKKMPKSLAWAKLSQRIESQRDNLNSPPLQEINEMVKETRRSRRARSK